MFLFEQLIIYLPEKVRNLDIKGRKDCVTEKNKMDLNYLIDHSFIQTSLYVWSSQFMDF